MNLRPLDPQSSALPDCATPRIRTTHDNHSAGGLEGSAAAWRATEAGHYGAGTKHHSTRSSLQKLLQALQFDDHLLDEQLELGLVLYCFIAGEALPRTVDGEPMVVEE